MQVQEPNDQKKIGDIVLIERENVNLNCLFILRTTVCEICVKSSPGKLL